jgi:multidrug resistance protein
MTMSFALAQLLAAPIFGLVADRFGRRPPILLALAAFLLANLGFLLARSVPAFVLVRTLEGALTAGLFPSAMGMVADIVPENQRARWVGIVMGGYGAGFFLGPVVGGLLYDNWGYAAPFLASAIMAALALLAAWSLVPETRTLAARLRARLEEQRRSQRSDRLQPAGFRMVWDSLPRPLTILGMLLYTDFLIVFAFAFIEPQMIFYFYDHLGWSTVQFGVVVAAYGLTTVIGQVAFGRSSDRRGRKPVTILGLSLNAIFYVGMALLAWLPDLTDWFPLILVVSVIAGLGEALALPALSAFYLDITAQQHRGLVMGIKEAAASLGGVLGPMLVVGVSALGGPLGVFASAAFLVLLSLLAAAVVLREPRRAGAGSGAQNGEYTMQRALAATSTLNGVVSMALASRRQRRVR